MREIQKFGQSTARRFFSTNERDFNLLPEIKTLSFPNKIGKLFVAEVKQFRHSKNISRHWKWQNKTISAAHELMRDISTNSQEAQDFRGKALDFLHSTENSNKILKVTGLNFEDVPAPRNKWNKEAITFRVAMLENEALLAGYIRYFLALKITENHNSLGTDIIPFEAECSKSGSSYSYSHPLEMHTDSWPYDEQSKSQEMLILSCIRAGSNPKPTVMINGVKLHELLEKYHPELLKSLTEKKYFLIDEDNIPASTNFGIIESEENKVKLRWSPIAPIEGLEYKTYLQFRNILKDLIQDPGNHIYLEAGSTIISSDRENLHGRPETLKTEISSENLQCPKRRHAYRIFAEREIQNNLSR